MTALLVWHRFIVADRGHSKELLASVRTAANAYGAAGATILAGVDNELLLRIDTKEATKVAEIALDLLARGNSGELVPGAVGMISGEPTSEQSTGGMIHGGW